MSTPDPFAAAEAEYLRQRKQPATDPYANAEAEYLKQQPALGLALQQNPDQVAANLKNAKTAGVPPAFAAAAPDQVAALARRTEINTALNKAPVTRSMMSDPRFASLATDDVESLGLVEQVLNDLTYAGRAIGTWPANLAKVPWQALTWSAETINQMAQMLPGKDDGSSLMRPLAAYARQNTANLDRLNRDILGSRVGVSSVGQTVGQGVESVGTSLSAFAATALTRNPNVGYSVMFGSTAAPAYEQGRAAGLDPLTATSFASAQGSWETITEMLPFGALLKDLKVGAPAWKIVLRQLALENATEQVATLTQDATEWAFLNPDKTVGEFLAERPQAALDTLIATTAAVGLQTGLSITADRIAYGPARKAQAEENRKLLELLNKRVKDTKLHARSASDFADFAGRAAGATNVYVEANRLAEVLQSSGLTMQQLGQVDPEIAADLEAALQSGGHADVVVPIGRWASTLAQSAIGDSLLDHARLHENALSTAEIADLEEAEKAMVADAEARLAASPNSEERAKSLLQVTDYYREQLANNALFMDAKQRGDAVGLLRAYYSNLSSLTGMMPHEIAFGKDGQDGYLISFEPDIARMMRDVPGFAANVFESGTDTATILDRLANHDNFDVKAARSDIQAVMSEGREGDGPWAKKFALPDGRTVAINSAGVGKLVNGYITPARVAVLSNLQDVLDKSKHWKHFTTEDGRTFDYFLGLVNYDGKRYAVVPQVVKNKQGDDYVYTVTVISEDEINKERVQPGSSLHRRVAPALAGESAFMPGGVLNQDVDTSTWQPIPDGMTEIDVDGVVRPVFTSDGSLIHPTIEGTTNFWRNFKDSKVLDSLGRPVVVFHGTPKKFGRPVFDPNRLGTNTQAPSAREGFFFSGKRGTAESESYVTTDELTPEAASEYLTDMEGFWRDMRAYLQRIADAGVDVTKAFDGQRDLLYLFFARVRGSGFRLLKENEYSESSDIELTSPSTLEDTRAGHGMMTWAMRALTQFVADLEGGYYDNAAWFPPGGHAKLAAAGIYQDASTLDDLSNDLMLIDPDSKYQQGGYTYEMFLNLVNPMVYDQRGAGYREETYYDLIKRAKDAGHDGLIIKNTYDGGPLDDIYVAFNNKQMKDATDNSGWFDLTSSNFLEQMKTPFFTKDHPGFQAWARTDVMVDRAGAESWNGAGPVVFEAYHIGPDPDIKKFRSSENDFDVGQFEESSINWLGFGSYFTNDTIDTSNYGLPEGADMRQKIEMVADNLGRTWDDLAAEGVVDYFFSGENGDSPPAPLLAYMNISLGTNYTLDDIKNRRIDDAAKTFLVDRYGDAMRNAFATKAVFPHGVGFTYPLHIRMNRPLDLRTYGRKLEIRHTEVYDSAGDLVDDLYEGEGADLLLALVARLNESVRPGMLPSRDARMAIDALYNILQTETEVNAGDIFTLLSNQGMYPGQTINETARLLGYDGLVMDASEARWGPFMRLNKRGALHFLPFVAENVKSVFNDGRYQTSPDGSDILNQTDSESISFVSPLMTVVNSGPIKGMPNRPKKGTGEEWKKWLDSVQQRGALRSEERADTGIDTWLAAHEGVITEQEVQDYVANNQIRVWVTTLSQESGSFDQEAYDEAVENRVEELRDEHAQEFDADDAREEIIQNEEIPQFYFVKETEDEENEGEVKYEVWQRYNNRQRPARPDTYEDVFDTEAEAERYRDELNDAMVSDWLDWKVEQAQEMHGESFDDDWARERAENWVDRDNFEGQGDTEYGDENYREGVPQADETTYREVLLSWNNRPSIPRTVANIPSLHLVVRSSSMQNEPELYVSRETPLYYPVTNKVMVRFMDGSAIIPLSPTYQMEWQAGQWKEDFSPANIGWQTAEFLRSHFQWRDAFDAPGKIEMYGPRKYSDAGDLQSYVRVSPAFDKEDGLGQRDWVLAYKKLVDAYKEGVENIESDEQRARRRMMFKREMDYNADMFHALNVPATISYSENGDLATLDIPSVPHAIGQGAFHLYTTLIGAFNPHVGTSKTYAHGVSIVDTPTTFFRSAVESDSSFRPAESLWITANNASYEYLLNEVRDKKLRRTVVEFRAEGEYLPVREYRGNHFNNAPVDTFAWYRHDVYDGHFLDAYGRAIKAPLYRVQEVQSDPHQAAQDTGYATLSNNVVFTFDPNTRHFETTVNGHLADVDPVPASMMHRVTRGSSEVAVNTTANGRVIVKDTGAPIPALPFKKSWPLLVMRQALQHAVDNNMKYLALVPGEVQATRWDHQIRDRMDTIELTRVATVDRPENEFKAARYRLMCYKNGRIVHNTHFASGVKMRETLGSELLNRLMADMDANYPNPLEEGHGVVTGTDIKVGGSGITKFYNERIPNDFNAAFKKFGMRMQRMTVYDQPLSVRTHVYEVTSEVWAKVNSDPRTIEPKFRREPNDPSVESPVLTPMRAFRRHVGADSEISVYEDFLKMASGQFTDLSARYYAVEALPYGNTIPLFFKVPLYASPEEIDIATEEAVKKLQAMYRAGIEADGNIKHELLVAEIPDDLAKAIKSGSSPQPLYQGGSKRKAAIDFGDPAVFARISFSAQSDYSSFVHEVAHFMLEVYADMIRKGTAPDLVKEDVATLVKWLGFNGTPEEWAALDLGTRRGMHEQFARTFEVYTLNNQAPSAALGGLFARSRNYMLNTYKEMRGRFAYIAPEVKDAMARMLASREAVARMTKARGETALLTPANKPENMSDSEWREYEAQARAANENAESIAMARSLRDLKWLSNAKSRVMKDLQNKKRSARAAVREEVATEAAKLPVYRATLLITKGQIPDGEDLPRAMRRAALDLAQGATSTKLSTTRLREIQGDGPAAPWRYLPTSALAAENGADPDVIAALAGFDSADAMIRALVEAPKFNDYVEAKTDNLMMQRHGDMMDDAAMERAADQAVHNAFRQKFLATELRALEMAMGNKANASQVAIAFGKRLVMQTPLKKLRFEAFAKAAQRAADAALKFFGEGKTREAANEKRNQLVNFVAAREAVRVAAQIDRARKRLKNLKKDNIRQAIGQDALDQMESILVRFGLMERPANQQPRAATLADYIAGQDALGIGLDLAPILLDETMSKPLDELTVEEALDVLNGLRQIEQSGRNARKLLIAGRRATLQQIKADVLPTISAASDGRVVDNTTRNTLASRSAKLFRGFFAIHRKLASLVAELDGFQQAGPLWDALIRPMNRAGNREASMRHEATNALAKLLEPLKSGPKFNDKMFIDSLGRSMTREERLAFALNVGNEGNLQRLMDGGNFTRDQVDAVLDTLTQEEWKFVQGVWDLFESYKPLISAKERRVTGLEPEWIEATEVVTKFGPLRGGYYPIKYDTAVSPKAQQFADAEEAKQLMRAAFTASTTRRSFTKSRAAKVTGRPLLLTFSGIDQGLNEVIHDLCWHEWVITSNMILGDLDIDAAIRTGWGAEVVTTMKDTIKAIATGDQQQNNAFMRVLGKLRANTTVVGLGFNLVTAAMQVTGFAQSIQRVGPRYLSHGIRQYFTAPLTEIDNVRGKSEFMANRMRTMQREINELLNTVTTGAAKDRLVSAAMSFIAKMQLQVDMPTWLGAYERAMAEMPLGLDADKAEARAVALADQAVIDAQGSGQIGDLAEVQRGNNLLKLFTNFYSFFNVTWNMNVEAVKSRRREGQWVGLATDLALINVLPAVLGLLIREALSAGGGDDDDDWYEHVPGEVASFALGQLVGLREISASVKAAADTAMDSRAFGFDYQGPAGLRWVAEFGKVMKQTSQGEIDMPLIKSIINLIGLTAGIPTAQLARTVEGAVALAENDTDDPRALLTGAPR